MTEALQILNDIFESELTMNDIEKEVQEILPWDSFHIMNFIVEIEEKFQKEITIDKISNINYVKDLLNLIEQQER